MTIARTEAPDNRFRGAAAPGPVRAMGQLVSMNVGPPAGGTVTESFRAFQGDRELTRGILAIPRRSSEWHDIAARVLRTTA